MNKKGFAGAVVVVVIVSGLGAILWLGSSPSIEFHLEAEVELPRYANFTLFLADLLDTNLTISFVNDNSLLYRIDMVLYDPSSPSEAFDLDTQSYTSIHRFFTLVRVRSMNVTLGTGCTYDLAVWGTNLSTSITYDNGARARSELRYEASGLLLVRITENMTIMDNHNQFDIYTGISNDPLQAFYLDVDLPDGYGGQLNRGHISDLVPISFVERVGWTSDEWGVYSTVDESPLIKFATPHCEHIFARLIDG
ncbi:MAG: hypothetical protein ACXACG_14025 [Candidatus Thorarchaeota archaeon]